MKVSKKLAIQAIKLALAVTIVYFLLKSGHLSLEKVSVFLSRPTFFLSALLILGIAYVTNFYRWKIILKLADIDIRMSVALRLSMLGQFFSTFMPGSVGGDLIKAVYVARRFPTRRTQSVMTVLLDRLMGLFALVLLGALGFLFGINHFISSQHRLAPLALAAGWSFVVGAVGGLVLLLWSTCFPRGIPQSAPAFLNKLPMSTKWLSLYDLALSFQRKPENVWVAFVLAVFVQSLNLLVLLIIACSLYGLPPWGPIHIDTFVAASCLGLCLMALPLAPLGLGVGQAAFATMFSILGISDAAFGASVVTSYQVLSLILNLLGFYFYLSYRHEVEA